MPSANQIKVILIDDHLWVHEIVAKTLELEGDIQLIAQGSNGREAIKLCEVHQPDIVLMDVMMPVMGGIEATSLLCKQYPTVKFLVLSSFRDDDSVRAMLKNGAVGYVLKDSLQEDLASTIRTTYAGKAVFSAEVSTLLLQASQPPAHRDFALTRREHEILKCLTEGLNNAEIASHLTISQSTVKFHISNILYKMGVETRAQAIVLAVKNDLI